MPLPLLKTQLQVWGRTMLFLNASPILSGGGGAFFFSKWWVPPSDGTPPPPGGGWAKSELTVLRGRAIFPVPPCLLRHFVDSQFGNARKAWHSVKLIIRLRLIQQNSKKK